MANPEFTATFTVDGNWQTYENFILTLRSQVADPDIPPCRGLRQLPPENPDEAVSRRRWFAVVLRTNDSVITLRIRRENLYLDAYQMENGTWVEYSSSLGRLFPVSRIIDCDGSYPQLEVGTPGREHIGLDLEQLAVAVNMLAEIDGGGSDARMYQILVIQMICESLRLHSITRYLIAGHASEGAPAWMVGQEGSWRRLSRLLLAVNADRFQPFNPTNEFSQETQIWSVPDVINALGIVKPEPARRRVPRMADGMQEPLSFGGGPKVELFEFRINKIEEDITPAQLYGAITGKEVFPQYFYRRERGNPEEVNAGDFPLLTGPAVEAISACDTFTIEVDLKEKHNYGPDSDISRGFIHWNVYNLGSGMGYERFIEQEFPGYPGCSATIRYAVFSDAVGATIEVKLINGDGEDPANVYGDISAVNTRVIEGESVLFRRGKETRIDVRPGQLIPLSRAIVAVPINSNLHVRAKLWDYDKWSFDDEIANGTAKFQPRRYGTDTQKISGTYGEIEVKVTWSI